MNLLESKIKWMDGLIDWLIPFFWLIELLKVEIDIFTPGSPLCNSTSLSV